MRVTSALILCLGIEQAPAFSEPNDAPYVESLLAQMSLDEKVGQMTQVDTHALEDRADIQRYSLGSVLSGGNSDPDGADNSPQGWLNLSEDCRARALRTRLKIPLLFGIDAVHGHNNVVGAVIFPHNIGLGATRDPALVEQAAQITAQEMLGTGIRWAFAPCVAVAQDGRWGRTYESFGSSSGLVSELGVAVVRGLQGARLSKDRSVLACAKHFIGDGGTGGGVDQGETLCDEDTLRRIHLPPYSAAVEAGVGSIMVSYSSWNGLKMHGQKHLITDVLKGELGFQGIVVSDWAAIDQLPGDYKSDIETSVNAGLDMVMIPYGPGQPNNYVEFIHNLKELVEAGKVPRQRIDDAVRRILRVKMDLGLFDSQPVDPALTAAIGSKAHRAVARECVRRSLVLLKNEGKPLPFPKNLKQLHVIGRAADDLGVQCGGWTIGWQGERGAVTRGGTTLLEAIRQTVSRKTVVSFSPDGSGLEGADVVLVVVGEQPYAEMHGDRRDVQLSAENGALVRKAKQSGAIVVTVVLSGRPLLLGDALEASDACVAAWLPGTEGEGVTDVLFGEYCPTGRLPRPWPLAGRTVDANPAALSSGYGLSYGEGGLDTSNWVNTALAE